jgi:hypothetical protein
VNRPSPRRCGALPPLLAAVALAALAAAAPAHPARAQDARQRPSQQTPPPAADDPFDALSRAAEEPPAEPRERVPFAAERPAPGARMAVAATVTPDGPLFALEPLVAQLGGELTVGPAGAARQLVIDGHRVLFGPDNTVALVDGEPVRMATPPVAAGAEIQVPLDFLRATYGELLGYRSTAAPRASSGSRST